MKIEEANWDTVKHWPQTMFDSCIYSMMYSIIMTTVDGFIFVGTHLGPDG